MGRVGPLMGRSEEPSLTTCSRRGCAPPRIGGGWGSRPLQKPPRGAAVPLYLYPEKPQKLHPTVQPNRKKNKKTGGPPRLFGGEPLCMLRLTTHQHVPSNATCDPGKIIVPQLLKIARKSVIITKLDCIHFNLETYRSGRNENDSKSFCLEIGTWVRIPPSPPG